MAVPGLRAQSSLALFYDVLLSIKKELLATVLKRRKQRWRQRIIHRIQESHPPYHDDKQTPPAGFVSLNDLAPTPKSKRISREQISAAIACLHQGQIVRLFSLAITVVYHDEQLEISTISEKARALVKLYAWLAVPSQAIITTEMP